MKQVANVVNGSTLLGLAIARAGRAHMSPGPRGLVLATGYTIAFPLASAFSIGNVVISREDTAWLERRPRLLAHEERHTWQYVACLGLPMIPLYLIAAGYSFLRGGDPATYNVFERRAGLGDGGYPHVQAPT